MQWQVRFPTLVPESTTKIHDDLNISDSNFNTEEILPVLRKLKNGKSPGHDNIPPDFWKYVIEDVQATHALLGICNHCWETSQIPKAWKISKVILLFKKGDVTLPQNYRPISLLPVGYKVLAALLHQRLIDSGVDAKICSSQYGFRPKRNCSDALMIVRRMIDAAYESKHAGLLMVFLDWAKVFDRIKSDSLVLALERFGFSPKVVRIIGAIYQGREFFVQDHSGISSIYVQEAGIA